MSKEPEIRDDDAESVRRYVEAAENQYRDIPDMEYLLDRPMVDFALTPLYYYRVGVLLSTLEAGYHDVLDFGAGSCWLGAILYRLGSRVTFLEVSQTALDLGKKLIERLKPTGYIITPPRFLSYDGFTFPLDNESIDRIISFDSFHHVPNPKRILEEMYRVLRPGGRVVFAEPGEGHGGNQGSQYEMKKHGVLESDVSFEFIAAISRNTGFNEVYFKPFPKVETMTLTDKEYMAFQRGKNEALPHDQIRSDIRYFLTIVLTKSPRIIDTRFPIDLRARIELLEKPTLLTSNAIQTWKVRYTNMGDTSWLSPVVLSPDGKQTLLATGGHAWVTTLLRDKNDNLINQFHNSVALPKTIHSGQNIEMSLEIQTPKEAGDYIYDFDLEARGHYMFSDTHRNSSISNSLKVPIKIS